LLLLANILFWIPILIWNILNLPVKGFQLKITRCQLLGKLMEDRLYAHQALQDSTIVVKDAEINGMMEERIGYMLGQIG
jgi:peptidyl-prolyl cis-trans isomerase SurA